MKGHDILFDMRRNRARFPTRSLCVWTFLEIIRTEKAFEIENSCTSSSTYLARVPQLAAAGGGHPLILITLTNAASSHDRIITNNWVKNLILIKLHLRLKIEQLVTLRNQQFFETFFKLLFSASSRTNVCFDCNLFYLNGLNLFFVCFSSTIWLNVRAD